MNKYREKIQFFTEEVWNKKNLRVFDEMIHQDFIYNDPVATSVNNKDEYKAFISDIQSRSLDMNYETLDIIAECNKVVVLYSFQGTPATDPAGVSLSGKKVEHKGTAIYYFDKDKIVKIWDVWDLYSVLIQLGKIPNMYAQ
jgi:steroid delta-isomerase-like uncharacterized protein